jgi:hypothetical protein
MREERELSEKASRLIAYCRENGRICPQPDYWDRLWKMLPGLDSPEGQNLPIPLILGGWHYSSNIQKIERLKMHIEWADQHGAIDNVDAFLRGLREEDWHHRSKHRPSDSE